MHPAHFTIRLKDFRRVPASRSDAARYQFNVSELEARSQNTQIVKLIRTCNNATKRLGSGYDEVSKLDQDHVEIWS